MNEDCFRRYYAPAHRNLFQIIEEDSLLRLSMKEYVAYWKQLDDALGIHMYVEYQSRRPADDFEMSDEHKQLFTQLAGPYGHTILKLWQMRKANEKNRNNLQKDRKRIKALP